MSKLIKIDENLTEHVRQNWNDDRPIVEKMKNIKYSYEGHPVILHRHDDLLSVVAIKKNLLQEVICVDKKGVRKNEVYCAFNTSCILNNDFLIYSADIEDDGEDYDWAKEAVGTSYHCIAQLTGLITDVKVEQNLLNGNIKILDASPDEKRTCNSKKILPLAKLREKLNPPQSGFTLIRKGDGYVWHRSGSVLFSYKGKHYLVGQDEGTYFGVELATKEISLKKAFENLIPKEVRGKKYKRQGEWFMVPVKVKDVPPIEECIGQDITSMSLPVKSKDDNRHELEGNVRIKDNRIYAYRPFLSHDQHGAIACAGWVTFYRNTAVRSVSQEGVD